MQRHYCAKSTVDGTVEPEEDLQCELGGKRCSCFDHPEVILTTQQMGEYELQVVAAQDMIVQPRCELKAM